MNKFPIAMVALLGCGFSSGAQTRIGGGAVPRGILIDGRTSTMNPVFGGEGPRETEWTSAGQQGMGKVSTHIQNFESIGLDLRSIDAEGSPPQTYCVGFTGNRCDASYPASSSSPSGVQEGLFQAVADAADTEGGGRILLGNFGTMVITETIEFSPCDVRIGPYCRPRAAYPPIPKELL
jgi:hypothetical protein